MDQSLPRIYLVRHGETAWTQSAQHTGRTDLPLNQHGEQQARELQSTLAKLEVARLFASPLQRARRTAELSMPQRVIETDDDLLEWDHGIHEGRRTVDIELDHPGWRLLRDGSPGGENIDDVCTRADRVIDRLRSVDGNTMLFGHREILRVLAVRWIGLPPIEARKLLLATASLSILGYDHDLSEPVIHAWNTGIA